MQLCFVRVGSSWDINLGRVQQLPEAQYPDEVIHEAAMQSPRAAVLRL